MFPESHKWKKTILEQTEQIFIPTRVQKFRKKAMVSLMKLFKEL